MSAEAFDDAAARRLGGLGVGMKLARADGDAATGAVSVAFDASGFSQAYGGGFLSRLVVVQVPACALTTPTDPACTDRTVLPTSVDTVTGLVSADVPVAGDPTAGAVAPAAGAAAAGSPSASPAAPTGGAGTVVVLASQVSSADGNYGATPLQASGRWSVGLQSGSFQWSYPLPQVPALGGGGPGLSLDYSSASVDGMTSAENAQTSWAGLGFDVIAPHIDREYGSCVNDGHATMGDFCWGSEALRITLGGHSTRLVKDTTITTADVWRLQDDPGWRVQRSTGAVNGDNNGEFWTVFTPDGTQYIFGRGRQFTTNTLTNSVLTVPVYGDDSGEPCYSATLASAWCAQAWRWSLDEVVDSRGNEQTYFYAKETNKYSRNGTTDTVYDRAGFLNDIEYDTTYGSEGTQAPAKLHFSPVARCRALAGGGGSVCPSFSVANQPQFPDVPMDLICSAACSQKSPSFFTGYMLDSVASQRWAGAAGPGGRWTRSPSITYFTAPTDGSPTYLWLSRIHHVGTGGGGSASLPDVAFQGVEYANRSNPVGGVLAALKLRVSNVYDELSGRTDITYSQPDPCSSANLPSSHPDTNLVDCFPVYFTPTGGSGGFGWFQKWLVSNVTRVDRLHGGGGQDISTTYQYNGDPAWHYDDDPITPAAQQSWGDWRGYREVDVMSMSNPAYHGEGTARPLTYARSLFFRGMYGDKLANGSTKTDSFTDSTGPSVLTDWQYLNGRVREQRQWAVNSTGGYTDELSGSIHGYTAPRVVKAAPPASDPNHDAFLMEETVTIGRQGVFSDPGNVRTGATTTQTDRTYSAYGQLLTETNHGASASDYRCTAYSYTADAGSLDVNRVAYPSRVRTFAASCTAPTAMLASTDLYYNGSTTWGGPVTGWGGGNVTKTVTAVTATNATTVGTSITTSATYDTYGRVLTAVDGNAKTTTTAYTPPTGIPSTMTVTAPAPISQSRVTTFEADRLQPVAVRDVNSRTTTLAYDGLGRLAKVWLPDQPTTGNPTKQYLYSLSPTWATPPQITSKQLQPDGTYVFAYTFLDSLGQHRQDQVVSPATTTTQYAIVTDHRYDDLGHLSAQTQPSVMTGAAGTQMMNVDSGTDNETRYSYDAAGRQITASYFSNNTQQWTTTTGYYGDHTRTTPPAGGLAVRTNLDPLGRTTSKVEGTSTTATTSYGYDKSDRLISITDPGSHASTFGYDLLGRRTTSTDPDAGTTSTTYDANSNPVTTKDAATTTGVTTTTVYDAVNRPTQIWAGPAGTGTQLAGYAYDSTTISNGLGHLASQTTYTGGKTYTQAATGYDVRGRPLGTTWTFPALGGKATTSTYTVTHGYDTADRPTTITYPDAVTGTPAETITTGYDTLGLPRTLTSTLATNPTLISGTAYQGDGALSGRVYAATPTNITRTYGYQPTTHRLSTIKTYFGSAATGTKTQDDTYTYDPAGNTTSITDAVPATPVATCHTYDTLARLAHSWTTTVTGCTDTTSTTTAAGTAGYNQAWTYTTDGNTLTTRALATTKTDTYGAPTHPHAATGLGTDTYGYDTNGNQNTRTINGVTTTLAWNALHQLTTTTSGTQTTTYASAPDGSRLARLNPDGSAVLYIDGQEVTLTAGAATATRYYTLAGTLVAVRAPTGLTWQLNDAQASAQIAIPEGTSTLNRTYYDPYGAIRTGAAAPFTDHGFLGKIKDPTTGLNKLGARYYDPALTHFISPDPLNDQSTAQASNAYLYAAANPTTYTDPTGLEHGDQTGSNCVISCGLTSPAVPEAISNPVRALAASGEAHGDAGGGNAPINKTQQVARSYDNPEDYAAHQFSSRGYGFGVNSGAGPHAFVPPLGMESQWLGFANEWRALNPADAYTYDTYTEPEYRRQAGFDALFGAAFGAAANRIAARGSVSGAANTESRVLSKVDDLPCNCFVAGTTVQTSKGAKPIEDVRPGDQVWAKNLTTGKNELRPVTGLFQKKSTTLMTITLASGATVVVTQEHPFMVEGEGWVLSRDLLVGDRLAQRDAGTAVIAAIDIRSGGQTVYNFEVFGDHNYYVTEAQLLVHNCPVGASGGARLTNSQAGDLAKWLGYSKTNYRSSNQPVFRSGNNYITQDIDGHIGGTWKMSRTPDGFSKQDRLGTYDHELNWIGP